MHAYFWMFETLFLQLSVFVLSNNVIRQKLFSFMINEPYIANGDYSRCLCFDCIVFILISTYEYGSMLPKLLSNLPTGLKNSWVQNSEMKTKEVVAKHQPFCIQKKTEPVRAEQINLLFTFCKESSWKKNVVRPEQTVGFFHVLTSFTCEADIILYYYYYYLLR